MPSGVGGGGPVTFGAGGGGWGGFAGLVGGDEGGAGGEAVLQVVLVVRFVLPVGSRRLGFLCILQACFGAKRPGPVVVVFA